MERGVEVAPHRPSEGQDKIGDFAQVLEQAITVDGRFVEAGAERVVVRAEAIEQRPHVLEPREVADADRAAADLVLIGRADTSARGADLPRARCILAKRVEVAVDGEYQRA